MNHSRFIGRLTVSVLAIGLVWLAGAATKQKSAHAAKTTVGTVNYVEGRVLRAQARSQSFNTLRRGMKLYEGDVVKTKESSRFEAKLRDGSMLRLSSNSQLALDQIRFDRSQPRRKKKVRAKLFFGKVWASVTSLFNAESSFEVSTPNAVAGVRGTKFTATTSADGETTVKVYGGKVLVSNEPIYKVEGATRENRVEVPGPQEIGQQEWEQLIAEAMQVVRVAADGELGAAESFAMGSPEDAAWERWNAQRAQLAGFEE